MKVKYDSNWLFESDIGFGTYLHILNDAVLISNRIAHVNTKTYRLTLRRFNHPEVPFYRFSCNFCYNDATTISITNEEMYSVIFDVLNLFVNEIDSKSVVSFVAEKDDEELVVMYDFLIKKLRNTTEILSIKDFTKLKIPTDNKHKFYGFTRSKIRKSSLLTKLINVFRK